MSRDFQYKPKFGLDIRVRPPKKGEEEAKVDVHALKPGERPCDHPGCRTPATAKAPKSRDMLNEHYWFCQPHAAQYNKQWDFFSGMSEAQVRKHMEARATGERPTWEFKASNKAREAASFSQKVGTGQGSYQDPFGMFGARPDAKAAPQARHIGKLERNALADLDLEDDADAPKIRSRYKELLKRCHPDMNGGDRSAEDKLQKVIKAYKTLQKAKMA